MMYVYLNNQAYPLEEAKSLHDFLVQNNHIELDFAIAINQQFVPRAAYKTTPLQADDRIDLIVPMQGG